MSAIRNHNGVSGGHNRGGTGPGSVLGQWQNPEGGPKNQAHHPIIVFPR